MTRHARSGYSASICPHAVLYGEFMYCMLFQVRQQSTHVCQESSMHEQTTAPEEQHRSMLEAQWIHEQASMNHCAVIAHSLKRESAKFVRLLLPGRCCNLHVVPRVTAKPARVFRNGDPETLPLCAVACEHLLFAMTRCCIGEVSAHPVLAARSRYPCMLSHSAGHHLSACSALPFFGRGFRH